MARLAAPATVAALVLSDVIGDPLDSIASGPTVPDPSTFADALAVIDGFHLRPKLPPAVLERLEAGSKNQLPETPKPGDPLFRAHPNRRHRQQFPRRARRAGAGAPRRMEHAAPHHLAAGRSPPGRAFSRCTGKANRTQRRTAPPAGLPDRRRRDDRHPNRQRAGRAQPGDGPRRGPRHERSARRIFGGTRHRRRRRPHRRRRRSCHR